MASVNAGTFILHDDFQNIRPRGTNTVVQNTVATLRSNADRLAMSGADIISVCASLGEVVNYFPAAHGEHFDLDSDQPLAAWGVDPRWRNAREDPYGSVVNQMRSRGIPVLAKFRVNASHDLGKRTCLESRVSSMNPQWHIQNQEQDVDMASILRAHPSVGTNAGSQSTRHRSKLLDYVSPSEGWVTDFNMDVQTWTRLRRMRVARCRRPSTD